MKKETTEREDNNRKLEKENLREIKGMQMVGTTKAKILKVRGKN